MKDVNQIRQNISNDLDRIVKEVVREEIKSETDKLKMKPIKEGYVPLNE